MQEHVLPVTSAVCVVQCVLPGDLLLAHEPGHLAAVNTTQVSKMTQPGELTPAHLQHTKYRLLCKLYEFLLPALLPQAGGHVQL